MRWLIALVILSIYPSAVMASDLDLFIKIIECESGGRHNAKKKDEPRGGPSSGIAQFQQDTFREFKIAAGHPEYRWNNPVHQMRLLQWVIEKRPDLLTHWSCYKKMKRGGVSPNKTIDGD